MEHRKGTSSIKHKEGDISFLVLMPAYELPVERLPCIVDIFSRHKSLSETV